MVFFIEIFNIHLSVSANPVGGNVNQQEWTHLLNEADVSSHMTYSLYEMHGYNLLFNKNNVGPNQEKIIYYFAPWYSVENWAL